MAGKEGGKEQLLYRISTEEEWEELRNIGSTHVRQLDKSTCFIHLSAVHQVRPTLQRFFPNTDKDLYLLQIDAKKLGDGVVYEALGASNVFSLFYGPSRSFAPLSRVL